MWALAAIVALCSPQLNVRNFIRRFRLLRAVSHRVGVESLQNLRHSGPADAKVSSKLRTALELARVEERLIIPGELERMAKFFRRCRYLRFRTVGTVPGDDLDNRRSS